MKVGGSKMQLLHLVFVTLLPGYMGGQWRRVSSGLGMYEGATGSMNWQCWSNCTIALDVCVLDAVQQN